jgi:hypothetical protein
LIVAEITSHMSDCQFDGYLLPSEMVKSFRSEANVPKGKGGRHPYDRPPLSKEIARGEWPDRLTAALGLAATGKLLRYRKQLDRDPSWEGALAIST